MTKGMQTWNLQNGIESNKKYLCIDCNKNPKGYGHFFLVSNFHVWTENMGSLNFETDSQKSFSD